MYMFFKYQLGFVIILFISIYLDDIKDRIINKLIRMGVTPNGILKTLLAFWVIMGVAMFIDQYLGIRL